LSLTQGLGKKGRFAKVSICAAPLVFMMIEFMVHGKILSDYNRVNVCFSVIGLIYNIIVSIFKV
jgi:hypothetical protein